MSGFLRKILNKFLKGCWVELYHGHTLSSQRESRSKVIVQWFFFAVSHSLRVDETKTITHEILSKALFEKLEKILTSF